MTGTEILLVLIATTFVVTFWILYWRIKPPKKLRPGCYSRLRHQRKKRYPVFALLTMLLCFASCGCKSSSVEILNKPLYQGDGWNIWTAQSGDVIVYYYYTRIVSRMGEDAVPVDFGEVFRQMDIDGSFKYFGFVITSTGGTSFWSDRSSILMTYIDDGDTLQIESDELFIIQKCDLQPICSEERMLQIPTGQNDIFDTPKGKQVLFAKFPLTSQPDAVLYCEAINTLSH